MVTYIGRQAAKLMHPDALLALARRYGPLRLYDDGSGLPVCLDCERPTDPGDLCRECRCCSTCCAPPFFTRG